MCVEVSAPVHNCECVNVPSSQASTTHSECSIVQHLQKQENECVLAINKAKEQHPSSANRTAGNFNDCNIYKGQCGFGSFVLVRTKEIHVLLEKSLRLVSPWDTSQ